MYQKAKSEEQLQPVQLLATDRQSCSLNLFLDPLIRLLFEARGIFNCVKNDFSWVLFKYHQSTVAADLNRAQSVGLEK